MREMNKKILSLFLAIVVCLGSYCSTMAFALEDNDNPIFYADKENIKIGDSVTFIVDFKPDEQMREFKITYKIKSELFQYESSSDSDVLVSQNNESKYYWEYDYDYTVSYREETSDNKCYFTVTFSSISTGTCFVKPQISYMNGSGTWKNVSCDDIFLNVYNPVGNLVGQDDYGSNYVTHTNYITYSNFAERNNYRVRYDDDIRSGHSGNLFWSLNLNSGLLHISGNGKMLDYVSTNNTAHFCNTAPWLLYKEYISSIKIDEGITSIGNYAFYRMYNLESVSLPDSIETIGIYAFDNCYYLLYIDLGENIENVKSYAFCGCSNLSNVKYSGYIKHIEDGNDCLKNADMIHSHAFELCNYSYENYEYGNGYSYNYYDEAKYYEHDFSKSDAVSVSVRFSDNTNVSAVTNTSYYSPRIMVVCVNGESHSSNYSLSGRTISAAGNCISLSLMFYGYVDFYLNADITYYYTDTVYRCPGCGHIMTKEDEASYLYPSGLCGNDSKWTLKNDTLVISGSGSVYNDNSWANYQDKIKSIVIEEGITTIGFNTFNGFESLEDVTLPNSLKKIDKSAFYNCVKLDEIVIPSNTTIDENAFRNCTGLKEITFGSAENITNVLNKCFSNCSNLSTAIVGENVAYIPNSAFENCKEIETVKILGGVREIGDSCFYNCTGLKTVEIPQSVYSIGAFAFYNCRGLQAVNLPENVNEISSCLFGGCVNLSSVSLSDNVSYIYDGAFENCSSLKSIEIPENVKEISSGVFYGCSNLQTVYYNAENCTSCAVGTDFGSVENFIIGDNVKSLPEYLLSNEDNIKSIYIPSNVNNIPDRTFYRCRNLEEVTFETDKPINIEAGAFEGSNKVIIVCKKDSFIQSYADINNIKYRVSNDIQQEYVVKNDVLISYDGENKNIYVNSATKIGYGAFENNKSIESVELFSGMTKIYNKAFSGCTKLATIILPQSITSIGDNAFDNCPNLTVLCYEGSYAESYAVSHNIPINYITLEVSQPVVNLSADGTAVLSASFSTALVDKTELVWTSDNLSAVTVTSDGVISAVGVGEATITVTSKSGLTATCLVNVTGGGSPEEKGKVNSVTVDDVIMNYQSSAKINPVIDSEGYINYSIEFKSDNSSVITVDKEGNIETHHKGNATITCTVKDENGEVLATDTCNVTVKFTFVQWLIWILLFGFLWY